MDLVIAQAKRIKGEVRLAGDRRLAIRALLLGCLATGKTVLKNVAPASEFKMLVALMERFGVKINLQGSDCEIEGKGRQGLQAVPDPLAMGNQHESLFMLAGLLAGQPFTSAIATEANFSADQFQELQRLGANIHVNENGGSRFAIHDTTLTGTNFEFNEQAGDVKNALLFAGLNANGTLSIKEPLGSNDQTERLMQHFGIPLSLQREEDTALPSDELQRRLFKLQRKKSNEKRTDYQIATLTPSGDFAGKLYQLPGDTEIANIFILGACLVPKSELSLKQVCLNSSRLGIIQALKRMDADIVIENKHEQDREVVGDIIVKSSKLKARKFSGEIITQVFNEIPLLAIAVAFAEGRSIIRNIKKLRDGEVDKLRQYILYLRRMGLKVGEIEDGMVVEGRKEVDGWEMDCADDLQLGMVMAVLGPFIHDNIVLKNFELVEAAFPGFQALLQAVQVKR